jgi:hypothetical protein
MSMLRLRVLKRHSSLETESLDDFIDTELCNKQGEPDLNLSVFDIAPACLIQTHAEFVVSFLGPQPKNTRKRLPHELHIYSQ